MPYNPDRIPPSNIHRIHCILVQLLEIILFANKYSGSPDESAYSVIFQVVNKTDAALSSVQRARLSTKANGPLNAIMPNYHVVKIVRCQNVASISLSIELAAVQA
jgi:hypothetical protein